MNRIFTFTCLIHVIVRVKAQVIYSNPDEHGGSIVEGLKCNFEFGVCGLDATYQGNSNFRFQLVGSSEGDEGIGDQTTGNGNYLAFTVEKEDTDEHSKFATLTLSSLTINHTYCLSFSYYINGGELLVLEQPSEHLRSFPEDTDEWKRASMTIKGKGRELRMRFLFRENAFGQVGVDDIELTVGTCAI